MEKLLQIKVMNNGTGQLYRLLGFHTKGDASNTNQLPTLSGFTLHDLDNKTVVVVNDLFEMRKYSVVTE